MPSATANGALHLLLIDDTEVDHLAARLVLEDAGLAVRETCRVETAEELELALAAQRWDVCLLDWVLPELTTPEALRILRASPQPQLPVIVWSGRDDAKVSFIAMEVLGAVAFLAKSKLARLPELVRQALGRGGGAP